MKSPEYSAGVARMRIAELALCTALDDDPGRLHSKLTAVSISLKAWRFETNSPVGGPYPANAKDLRHGLKMAIERGTSRPIFATNVAKNAKEGTDVTTTLYVPFQSRVYPIN